MRIEIMIASGRAICPLCRTQINKGLAEIYANLGSGNYGYHYHLLFDDSIPCRGFIHHFREFIDDLLSFIPEEIFNDNGLALDDSVIPLRLSKEEKDEVWEEMMKELNTPCEICGLPKDLCVCVYVKKREGINMNKEEMWKEIKKALDAGAGKRQDTYMAFYDYHNIDEPFEIKEYGNRVLAQEEVEYLIEKIGNAYCDNPLLERHNESPTIKTFFKWNKRLSGKMRFICYIVLPPRSDYRVTIDGWYAEGLTEDEFKMTKSMRRLADEKNWGYNPDKGFWVRIWWD